MRATIGRRIGGLAFLLVGLLMISSFTSYWSMTELVDATRQRKMSFLATAELDQIATQMLNAETGQRGYVITGDPSYLEPYTDAVSEIDRTLTALQNFMSADTVQAARLARLEPLVREKLTGLQRSIALRRDVGFEAAQALAATNEGKNVMDKLRDVLAEMAAHENAILDTHSKRSDTAIANTRVILLIVGLASLFVAIGASLMATRSVTVPLAELTAGTARLGGGDLDHRIVVRGSDEVSDLAEAFNLMIQRLRTSESRVNAQTAEREKVLAAVTEAVQQLGAASQELLAGATEQAAGMQQQAAAVAETVAVVDEVSHTATQAAERAKFVATSARRSEEVGGAGKRAVDETIEVIDVAKAQADSVAGNIASLAGHTQAIGEIVSLISDIAEQTNMLALNAAIEASRAGEHGRGFSVVAAEVKTLADESKQATRRVRQILGDIQKMANISVLSTEEGARSMTTATKQAAAAGQTIQALSDVIGEVAEAASQIAASAGQQAVGLTQIHQAMRDMKQVSTQNLVATQQAQRAAGDLAALGTSLTGLLASSPKMNG